MKKANKPTATYIRRRQRKKQYRAPKPRQGWNPASRGFEFDRVWWETRRKKEWINLINSYYKPLAIRVAGEVILLAVLISIIYNIIIKL